MSNTVKLLLLVAFIALVYFVYQFVENRRKRDTLHYCLRNCEPNENSLNIYELGKMHDCQFKCNDNFFSA